MGFPAHQLNYPFFEDGKKNNGYKTAKKIQIPTLVVHGDKDKIVPIKQSKKTSKIIKNCKLEIIKECDHRYTKPEHLQKAVELITEFITQKCSEKKRQAKMRNKFQIRIGETTSNQKRSLVEAIECIEPRFSALF